MCFGSTSQLTVLAEGGKEALFRVDMIEPGDKVKVVGGGWATVRCVVRSLKVPSKPLWVIPGTVNGSLVLTGSHPVRVDGKWRKPSEIGQAIPATDRVYNFVLDSTHVVMAGLPTALECVTLGHGLTEEGVVHYYYGTQRVIEDLMAIPSWSTGKVTVDVCLKDSAGKVVGILQTQPEKCAICFAKDAECAVVPCGHQCGCQACLESIKKTSGTCPICRGPLAAIMKVIASGLKDEEPAPAASSSSSTAAPTARAEITADLSHQVQVPRDAPVEVRDSLDLPEMEIEVAPSSDEGESMVMIRARVPEQVPSHLRMPVDLACVIDISASMATEATYETGGAVHSDGLSILDIVKHAVKVVIASLTPKDRLTLIAFDQHADLVLPLSTMTPEGKARAVAGLEALRPRGQTNLWGGLMAGMDSLKAGGGTTNKTVMLLTDGQPNITPSRGHIKELQRYREMNPGFSCQINTFGFGYSLDSELLLNLAKEGNGTYSFIPDAPIVGTVFVHSMANTLSTYGQKASLRLRALNGANFTGPVGGCLEFTDSEDGQRTVNISPLQFGQYREVVVPMYLPHPVGSHQPYLEVIIRFGSRESQPFRATDREPEGGVLACEVAALRNSLVQHCHKILKDSIKFKEGSVTPALMKDIVERIQGSPAAGEERVVALLSDTSGRLSKACDGLARWNRWGKHYMRALMRAHQMQLCTNFRDPGVQVYGGELFSRIRASGDKLFLSLPAPIPPLPCCPICNEEFSRAQIEAHVERCMGSSSGRWLNQHQLQQQRAGVVAPPSAKPSAPPYRPSAPAPVATSSTTVSLPPPPAPEPEPAPAPVDMTSYHNEFGGCFDPSCTVNVVTAGIECKLSVAQVQAGDMVRCAGGCTAQVLCVVRSNGKPSSCLYSIPGPGPILTANHPIRIAGVWMNPGEIGTPVEATGPVYNFVLDHSHVLIVNGFECVTLAHGLLEEGVAHPYYGTDRILHDLMNLPGWNEGRVIVDLCKRNAQGHIIGLLAASDNSASTSLSSALSKDISPIPAYVPHGIIV